MKEKAITLTVQYSRVVIPLLVLTLLLLIGGVGEVAAHGPCHANPGNVPDMVCGDLPSSEAPRGG